MTTEIAGTVRHFIQQNFYVDDPSRLAGGTSLVQEGIVDSTGMLEVISFLEAQFGIKIEDHETVPANLDTIDRIVEFVAKKKQPARS